MPSRTPMHSGISAYRKAFLIFWRWIFKEKTEEIWSSLFFTTWISWILNFIIKFNNQGRSQTFSFGGPLEGPDLQQGELSMVCVGLQCSGMTSRGKFWGATRGQAKFWGAVAPLDPLAPPLLTMLLLVLWRYWRHWIQIWSSISGCENTALPLSAPVQLATVG